MFEAIRRITRNMQSITAARIIEILVSQPELNNFIIELNTQDQLFKKGVDSKGATLGTYSLFTIAEKQSKGQPTTHVTLKNEGLFYKTWVVTVVNGDIIIEADGDKDDKNLMDVYGEDIVGLIEENVQKIADEIAIKSPELVANLLLA